MASVLGLNILVFRRSVSLEILPTCRKWPKLDKITQIEMAFSCPSFVGNEYFSVIGLSGFTDFLFIRWSGFGLMGLSQNSSDIGDSGKTRVKRLTTKIWTKLCNSKEVFIFGGTV